MTISFNQTDKPFWTLSPDDALNQLGTSRNGLAQEEVQRRLLRFGANLLKPKGRTNTVTHHILYINDIHTPFQSNQDLLSREQISHGRYKAFWSP